MPQRNILGNLTSLNPGNLLNNRKKKDKYALENQDFHGEKGQICPCVAILCLAEPIDAQYLPLSFCCISECKSL